MSERQSNLLLPIVGVVVIAGVGAGAYYFYQQRSQLTEEGIQSTARFIPSTAVMAASVSTDSKAWQTLERFQNPEVKAMIQEATKQLLPPDIKLEEDIQPWAGQTLLAVLPPDAAPQAQRPYRYLPVQEKPVTPPAAQPTSFDRFVAVVQIKNRGKADQFFLTKVTPKLSSPPKEVDFKGVKVFTSDRISAAFVDNYLVMAPQRQTLEQAIETFQGTTSFAQNIPTAKLDLQNPLLQVYVPNVAASLKYLDSLNPAGSQLSQPILKRLQEQAKAMVIGVGTEDTGIRLQALVNLGDQALPFQPSPGKVTSQFPAETYALVSGTNFKDTWKSFVDQAKTEPTQQEGIDAFRKQFKQNFNLDVDQDLFSWMDGEIALGVIPSDQGILKQARSGFVMVFQTSDRAAAEASLKKIDDLTKAFPFPVSVQSKDIAGIKVQEWTSSVAPGTLLGHGWHQPDTFFVAMGPLTALMAQKQTNPLENSPSFRSIAGSLDKKNQGYFYLDWEKVWSIYATDFLSNNRGNEAQKQRANSILSSVKGLAVTYSQPAEPTQSKVELFLSLKPQAAPAK